ncbi:hypothetical protein [Paraburkholderia sp. HP33-1]|uniref:hypothetical protein n=1 Tax=Paraburkholderia sp. HP33-1 TaxID=2883243 RepID=UPI001F2F5173|nr:hypothetical protein [Paraburkholderia sp. HP33-1]
MSLVSTIYLVQPAYAPRWMRPALSLWPDNFAIREKSELMLFYAFLQPPNSPLEITFFLYSDQNSASGGKHYSLFFAIESVTPHISALTLVFQRSNTASYTLHARVIAELRIIKVCYYVDSRLLIHRP